MMISEHADPAASPSARESGGQNVYVSHLACEMGRLGWEVDIYTRWDSKTKVQVLSLAPRVRVIRIKSGPKRFVPRDHLFQYLPEFVDNIIAFKRENKLEYDLVHSHYWMSGWSGRKLSVLWEIPLVMTYHSLGYLRYHALKKFEPARADTDFFRFRIGWEHALAEESDLVICTSDYERADLIKHYTSDARIEVVPAGINSKLFHPVQKNSARRRLGIDQQKTIILYAGRLEWRKGVGTLISSIQNLRKKNEFENGLQVLIVGRTTGADKKEYQRLKELAEKQGVAQYITFVGATDREEMKYFYSAADVCVVPSYYEPFGQVPLEAFSCHCPVIASRVGGLQYTVTEDTGYLVPPRRADSLAVALDHVLRNKEQYREKAIKFAREVIPHKFTWNVVSKQIEAHYLYLINTVTTR
jgi:D-inositol-3-phosphate glycosyltransferase